MAESLKTSPSALVVDDVSLNVVLLGDVLGAWGFECQSAADGFDAVLKYQNGKFDIIFMDIEMPGMNGIDAARTIRQLEGAHAKQVPIVAHTAYGAQNYMDKCLSAGMNDCIEKPYDFEQIFALIDKLIGFRP